MSVDLVQPLPAGGVQINGWAADIRKGRTLAVVFLRAGGKSIETAVSGLPRPDVASFSRNDAYLRSGWIIKMPAVEQSRTKRRPGGCRRK